MDENIPQRTDQQGHCGGTEYRKAENSARLILFPLAKMGRDHNARAYGDRHRQRNQDFNQRDRNGGGGHGVPAKPAANEYAVDNQIH